jgi:ADP-ribose pyrophosphatase YjhB (NUDIX family)
MCDNRMTSDDNSISKRESELVPRWLEWAREIQALAQTGYHYSSDEYNRQRFGRLLEIAAEIVSEQSNMVLTDVIRLYQSPIGYATPRIDVRGAVFQNGKLLLVRERMDGGWTLPGGWADVGDIPSGAAEREVWEEAGYKVKACKVIGVYDANRSGPLELFHAFKVVFLCDLISGEARPSIETSEVAFFQRDEIPLELSGERTRIRHIDDAFACLERPDIATVFD